VFAVGATTPNKVTLLRSNNETRGTKGGSWQHEGNIQSSKRATSSAIDLTGAAKTLVFSLPNLFWNA
jgi:hypothetical protein